MNGHATDWLPAYYDGELHGEQLAWVETHLAGCPACRMEIEQLERLSALLLDVPAPALHGAAGRFTSQVSARLADRSANSGWKRALRLGWQLAPLGLIAAWAFFQAALLMAGLLVGSGLGSDLGLERLPLLVWGSLPGVAGPLLLNWLAESVTWLNPYEGVLQLGFWNLAVTAIIGALLCGWVASWWAVESRQPRRQPRLQPFMAFNENNGGSH